jgi:hypothetical protein
MIENPSSVDCREPLPCALVTFSLSCRCCFAGLADAPHERIQSLCATQNNNMMTLDSFDCFSHRRGLDREIRRKKIAELFVRYLVTTVLDTNIRLATPCTGVPSSSKAYKHTAGDAIHARSYHVSLFLARYSEFASNCFQQQQQKQQLLLLLQQLLIQLQQHNEDSISCCYISSRPCRCRFY